MTIPWILAVVIGLCAIVKCQQPEEITSTEISSDLPVKCEILIQNLTEENDRLTKELEVLKAKLEAVQDLEDDESEGSNESHSRSRGLRSRRAANCDAGTLAAWACAPQCIFKLKGLCGLSLKSICHC